VRLSAAASVPDTVTPFSLLATGIVISKFSGQKSPVYSVLPVLLARSAVIAVALSGAVNRFVMSVSSPDPRLALIVSVIVPVDCSVSVLLTGSLLPPPIGIS